MNEYKLPDVGEGLTEAEIVTWKVKVGDVIKVNDIVVEIETAKSLVELPSPYAGTVTAILSDGQGGFVPGADMALAGSGGQFGFNGVQGRPGDAGTPAVCTATPPRAGPDDSMRSVGK